MNENDAHTTRYMKWDWKYRCSRNNKKKKFKIPRNENTTVGATTNKFWIRLLTSTQCKEELRKNENETKNEKKPSTITCKRML